LLFKNEKGKFDYVVKYIEKLHKKWQPVLVWTVSVDKSEYLSERLVKQWIPHSVLNAKQHEKEADIIAKAWEKWSITIATNMAWRWTDIKLWEWVVEVWGLMILWTEKHETRRIDNQLRWRAWRQWDPWVTQFLVSPNDDIMRIFWWDKLFGIFNSPIFASLPDDEPLSQSGMLTRKVTSVQKQVEWHNFDSRKHVLEYDDVINKHREVVYGRRNKILDSENIDSDIKDMIKSQLDKLILSVYTKKWENFEKQDIIKSVNEFLWIELIDDKIEIDDIIWTKWEKELSEYIWKIATDELDKIKEKLENIDNFYDLERKIVLQSIDELWMRHIDAMSHLRSEVAFEWYAQKNPLLVYKEKAFFKFKDLIDEIEYKVVKWIFSVNINANIQQLSIDSNNLKVNENDLKNMLNNLSRTRKQAKKSNVWASGWNPLFVNPENIYSNNQNNKKTKIRV
jgi:preprotein translocase subunit SecA